MRVKSFAIYVLPILLIASLANDNKSQAQSGPSIWDGIYSEAQAARGEQSYKANCVSCHAIDLRGNSNTPSLLGMSFMFIWEGKSVGEIFTKMSTEMPTDRPGVLPSQSYADILAFILSSNSFPTGESDLTSDVAVLEQILISAKP